MSEPSARIGLQSYAEVHQVTRTVKAKVVDAGPDADGRLPLEITVCYRWEHLSSGELREVAIGTTRGAITFTPDTLATAPGWARTHVEEVLDRGLRNRLDEAVAAANATLDRDGSSLDASEWRADRFLSAVELLVAYGLVDMNFDRVCSLEAQAHLKSKGDPAGDEAYIELLGVLVEAAARLADPEYALVAR